MTDETCQATTASGEGCKNQAQGDGYCWVEGHDANGRGNRGTPAGARNPQYDPELLAETIRQADGNLSEAARRFGCGRTTVERYVNDFPVCAQARDDARAKGVDDSRATILDQVNDEDLDPKVRQSAAKFYLKHYDGKAAERHDHTSSDGSMSPSSGVDWSELSQSDKDDIIETLEAAGYSDEGGP